MHHLFRVIAAAAVLAAGATLSLAALPARAAVSGLVGRTVDCASGAVLPHAHLIFRLKGSAAPERELTSDAKGHFTALGLVPGWYSVTIHGDGYWGPHNIKLDPDDVEHALVGASNDGQRCEPYTLPRHPQTTDQTTLD